MEAAVSRLSIQPAVSSVTWNDCAPVALVPVEDLSAEGGWPGRPRRASGATAPGRRQKTVTVDGGEAIPLATTTSELLPAGVPGGMVNWVEDLVPGATDTEVQLLVRA
jgi:hypothetical protein